MDEIHEPVSNQPAPAPEPMSSPKKRIVSPITGVFIILVIIIFIGISMFIRVSINTMKQLIAPKPSPSGSVQISPTPFIPGTQSSSIATDSAYITIYQETQALESDIRSFVIDDSTLTPPAIETTIDFAK